LPLAFPSHQGLIAPLWRRWPDSFHVLAMGIGAGMPDAVDGIAGAFCGSLGQRYGHSLLGTFIFCLPLGMALTWLTLAAGRHLPGLGKPGSSARRWGETLGRWIEEWNRIPAACASGTQRVCFMLRSMWIGAFSHVFFDFISHGGFPWFYPWFRKVRVFPDWWYVKWFEIPVFGYRDPYPMGPHLLVWIFFSVLGTVILFAPAWRRRRKAQ